MNDRILQRLLQAAAGESEAPAAMPFGFDTRVLALARSAAPDRFIALLTRRVAMIALAVIALTGAGLYQASASSNDLPSEYTMADNAIQSNIDE
ncbi:MAG: hypothetical protein M3R59_06065 [Verrucomicrobiota bacterium]|nr:hypothetical protein [Verrucomicrobiota bacterium]